MITLRPDQTATLDATRASFASGNRAVVMRAPTGFGKTVVAAEIARASVAKGRRVLISTPRIQLIRQAEKTLAEMGVSGVVVDTKQALVRGEIDCDVLIDDEAHYGFSQAWADRLAAHMGRGGWVLGLTASPIPGMDRIYQDVVHGPAVSWLMEGGHLSRYRAFGPATPDLSDVPISGGDYQKAALAEVMDKPAVTGDAVTSWLKMARGLRTVGYCVSRDHSRHTVAQFNAAGIPAEHIDGETPQAERDAIIRRFADRETLWLGSVGLITLGFDMSSQIGRDVPIEAMQDMAPTRSLPLHIQKLGRVLRKKITPAVILDHSGNIQRLGFPDDEFEWSITSGTRRQSNSGLAVSICARCFGAFRTAPACPYCETVRELTPREVEEREGELRELERVETAKKKRIEVGRADGLDALAKIAVERGYATGWLVKRMEIKGVRVGYDEAQRVMARVRAG